MASNRVDQLRAEFRAKNRFLGTVGVQLAPLEFFDLLYSDLEDDGRIMAVEAKKKYFTVRKGDILDHIKGRDDIYLSPVQFWDDYKKDDYIDKIWALVVDIDHVAPKALEALFRSVQRGTGPMPTVITNSGSGIHFYYILEHPYTLYSRTRRNARELYTALNRIFEFRTDKHSIGHAYRAVGALTKLGDVTTAFRVGELWTIEDLADAVDYVWIEPPPAAGEQVKPTDKMVSYAQFLAKHSGEPEPDYTDFNAVHAFIRAQHKQSFVRSGLDPRDFSSDRAGMYTTAAPNAGQGWYYDIRSKVMQRTELTHRYSSLMALCVIAYKCRIPYDQLKNDIDNIADEWEVSPRWAQDPFNRKNVPDALRCYSQRFVKVRRETLEEWLGWSMQRRDPPKRSQKDHLSHVADLRRGRSLGRIMEVLRTHPTASKSEISRLSGVSRPTVCKYFEAAKALCGIR